MENKIIHAYESKEMLNLIKKIYIYIKDTNCLILKRKVSLHARKCVTPKQRKKMCERMSSEYV